MNLNQVLSLPFIGFAFAILVIEGLGYEIVFRRFRISIKKGESIWDSVNIWIMFLSSVAYAGSLASTAGITFVEGYSWLRPGNAVAPLLGYMFGLPGCMGAALGNLLADSFSGYYSWASIGGFLGNFILAYIPHKVLGDPPLRRSKDILYFGIFVGLVSALMCAYIIVGVTNMITVSGLMYPIPLVEGTAPPIQRLSEDAMWGDLFNNIFINNIPMNLVSGALIMVSFRYLSEKGLFWKDRLGLFESRSRVEFLSFLLLIAASYVIYNFSAYFGVYGKIGRSQNYLVNIMGIAFLTVALLGFFIVSTNAVKGRILAILMGKRSVDARALEVYFAARRDTSKAESEEAIGERLGRLLFSKVLLPNLTRLLKRSRVKTFIADYLRYVVCYMMNSKCFVKKGLKDHSMQILINECIVCKGLTTNAPACKLVIGFLRSLTETFTESVKGEHLKVYAQEVECRAMGKEFCRIELSWGE